MLKPSATRSENNTTPQKSRVSRKDNAMSTGMNVPKASMPIMLRMTTMISAPIGIISNTL